MNKNNVSLPWNLTFSYGRALQADALIGWVEKIEKGQEAFLNRAKSNGLVSWVCYKKKCEILNFVDCFSC